MKILVPIDFSENSIKALELALSLNKKQKTTIILVNIVELVYDFASQAALALDGMHRDASKILNELKAKYTADHLDFKLLIEEGTASISIARMATQHEADLIVMGTSGAGEFKKFIMGSTTRNLLKETNTSVLVVPAQANLTNLNKLRVAIQFSEHERLRINHLMKFKNRWEMDVDFFHIASEVDFKDELACLGFKDYMKQQFGVQSCQVTNLISNSVNEGIKNVFQTNEGSILVMCHQHKSFWKEFTEGSHSLEMAVHESMPVLVLN